MKYKRLAATGLACFLLSGCGGPASETTLPPETVPAVIQTEPAGTTLPVPETTVPPTTEPEPVLEAGVTVVTDGDTLASGSVLSDGITYVKAVEFFAAMDGGECSGSDETGYTLLWQGTEYAVRPGNEGLIRDGKMLVPASPVLTRRDGLWVPVEELCGLMNIPLLSDPAKETLYCTAIAADWDWEMGVKIPILMYHGVTDDVWGASELFVSPSDMEAQIQYLVENGYDTITFEDWSHLEDFDKPVMLTYDDGYMDNYEELFPILQKYNAKATIFAITTSVDRDERTMTSQQAREMTESGLVSIQSHTYNHPHLSECDAGELHKQMLWSKLHVARMTGYEPFVICYPYGDSDPEARDVASQYYNFGLNMTGGLYTTSSDVFQIPRYYVARDTGLSAFMDMVDEAGR